MVHLLVAILAQRNQLIIIVIPGRARIVENVVNLENNSRTLARKAEVVNPSMIVGACYPARVVELPAV